MSCGGHTPTAACPPPQLSWSPRSGRSGCRPWTWPPSACSCSGSRLLHNILINPSILHCWEDLILNTHWNFPHPSHNFWKIHSIPSIPLFSWEIIPAGANIWSWRTDATYGGDGGGEAHGRDTELPLLHVDHVAPGLQVDFVVESDHDEDGQPEGETGGHDGVGVVHYEPALVRVTALVNNSVSININTESQEIKF